MPWVIAVATVFTMREPTVEAFNQMRTVSTRALSLATDRCPASDRSRRAR
jgi:hypothetical protein